MEEPKKEFRTPDEIKEAIWNSEEHEKERILENELYLNNLDIATSGRVIFLLIGLCFLAYIAVIYFYKLSFENAWLIGFPLFLILVALGYITLLIIVFGMHYSSSNDYSRRKLKEMNRSLHDIERNK